ncbi:serpin family protein [Lentzea albida]|uniref:Serpin B n=1 Tax=Lentzea albida TaxID=65499 RepID=A0A1H9UQY6_9PSEU|nr:serpin family protein [Lentzea albida]SES11741.1 serpin B [Lentzea albida]
MTDQTAFALTLHRAAVPDPSVNACWSPFSVASALALVHEASRGRTREELGLLIGGFDGSDALDVPDLAVANSLWADAGLPLDPAFSLTASVRRADFAESGTVRELINADVAEATRGLVPALLPPPSTPYSGAVVVNALYLRTGWETAFPASRTTPRPFHAPGGDVEVPTMTVTAELGYARTGGWQTVVLPAKSGVEVLVLLPDGPLDQPHPAAFDVPGSTAVALSLPKVDVREKFELREALEQVGVGTMFSPDADLSGLSPKPLFVSEVVHEAVLRLDEQGLEGAAATAVMKSRGARPRKPAHPVVVLVDRPFLLAVRHARSKAVYFLAQVARP